MKHFPTRLFVSLLTTLFTAFLVGNVSPMMLPAVGAQGTVQGHSKTLIEHWDGAHWSVVHSPNIGTSANGLSAVTAFSSSDIWAVGEDSNGKVGARTLIEHWNGKQWSVVQSPSV